ncbi:hypothetical protein [Sphingobacterium griseoflavum]|uniref:Outer membrane protein beta-barrel domain-containing protein n=1 Tax=Sphingobacterium griseoflavum TaxID=1474952 RepID=A0ABQ3HU56_9SPHI|nr:hypothetical protein [Sphingobacterium griseoflavum]GHE34745.1 hypothetical protein GCM10017764_17390 [Sphingobacterium griseoflavum]
MKSILSAFILCLVITLANAQDFRPYYSNNINFGVSYTHGQTGQTTMRTSDDGMDFLGLQFNYIGLVHLTPKVAIGAGTGIRHMITIDDWDDWYGYDDLDFIRSYFSVPLYAHAQFRFLDRKVSPFLQTSLGYHIRVGESDINRGHGGENTVREVSSISSGLLAGLQAGVSIHVGSRFNIMAGPYFEYRKATFDRAVMETSSWSTSASGFTTDLNLFEAGVKVGFTF